MGFFRKRTGPDRATEQFQAGMLAYRSGALEQAITELTAAIESDPDLMPARYQRGMAFARSGDMPRAIGDFQCVVDRSTDSGLATEAAYNLALASERTGDLEKAVDEYGRVVSLDPTAEKAFCNRGSVLNRLERFDEAVEDLTRALELDPADALAYWNRAIANDALREGDVEQDVKEFLRLAPADHPYRAKAERLMQGFAGEVSPILDQQRKREVQRSIERIIELNNEQRYEESLAICDRALALDESIEVAWDEKAFALSALDRFDEARAACERGLATIPEAIRLHHTHAMLLDRQGRDREALAEYRKYVELAPPEYGEIVAQTRSRIEQLEASLDG